MKRSGKLLDQLREKLPQEELPKAAALVPQQQSGINRRGAMMGPGGGMPGGMMMGGGMPGMNMGGGMPGDIPGMMGGAGMGAGRSPQPTKTEEAK